jgi:hypothetical protein
MSTRMLTLGHSELMTQIKIPAFFHHDSRRGKPSSDMARVTIRKTSFKPANPRSSHVRRGQDPPATCRTRNRVTSVQRTHLHRWHRFSAPTTVTTQLQVVSTAGGNWSLYGQTPTSAYTNAFGTRMMLYYWPQCPAGRWQWRVVAFVTIDGVYRGGYANDPHTWTACTTS